MTRTNNKSIMGAWWRYNNGYNVVDDIRKAYTKPSVKKIQAWEYCKMLCEEHNGKGLKVIGHNCNIFSAGFTYEENGRKMFCWITPTYNYCTDVTEVVA